MKQKDENEERPPVRMYACDTGTFLHCWICVPFLISITKHRTMAYITHAYHIPTTRLVTKLSYPHLNTQKASNTGPCILM